MALNSTNYHFPGQKSFYQGKVRDVYSFENGMMAMIATDRISAFDHVLPNPIPYKGQILSEIAAFFLEHTKHIAPNWLTSRPHPNVSFGHTAEPFKVEMVIRGYLAGHAARTYKSGNRVLCGVEMPEGLRENDAFPTPIITPTTKASEGHDEDISREEIISQGIVSEADYVELERLTRALFAFGSDHAKKQGLILVDTKYEFGKTPSGEIVLIDEIHTPDSSRYFYADGYETRQSNGVAQRQLSKEFVREWLIEQGFMGKEGQEIPVMPESFVQTVTDRYTELFERVTGKKFQAAPQENLEADIESAILATIQK